MQHTQILRLHIITPEVDAIGSSSSGSTYVAEKVDGCSSWAVAVAEGAPKYFRSAPEEKTNIKL